MKGDLPLKLYRRNYGAGVVVVCCVVVVVVVGGGGGVCSVVVLVVVAAGAGWTTVVWVQAERATRMAPVTQEMISFFIRIVLMRLILRHLVLQIDR